ncbi:hypothetical protein HDA40_005800 [Hamadaea flava]|uniref:Uncharacterized protein n=1 Tax=Hamadaea flava TaxID=1742688 RepID=A0ABV8LQZ9_9ACTN|nr:hypothetical protein [Hamadaea flava]MCP2327293.1 hypothetical protein [Hamadaea flava]
MSFDLYVWHEPAPLTADAALGKLEQWAEGAEDPFAAHPAVMAMRNALLERFPPLESLRAEELDSSGVWSLTPEPSESILSISIIWSRAAEVGEAVAAMANDYGLVCYEPGFHIVNPNAPGYIPAFVLTSAAYPDVPDPDAQRIEWTVRKLSNENHYAVLERADGWYVQVGFGEKVGAPAGTYGLEYREGSSDSGARAETRDVAEAVRLLQEFLGGQEHWKHRHAWKALAL